MDIESQFTRCIKSYVLRIWNASQFKKEFNSLRYRMEWSLSFTGKNIARHSGSRTLLLVSLVMSALTQSLETFLFIWCYEPQMIPIAWESSSASCELNLVSGLVSLWPDLSPLGTWYFLHNSSQSPSGRNFITCEVNGPFIDGSSVVSTSVIAAIIFALKPGHRLYAHLNANKSSFM